MSDGRPKVVRIEYEYDNGTVTRATGADAETIDRAITNAFLMDQIHGGRYLGPTLQPVPPSDPAAELARLRAAGDALAGAAALAAAGLVGWLSFPRLKHVGFPARSCRIAGQFHPAPRPVQACLEGCLPYPVKDRSS